MYYYYYYYYFIIKMLACKHCLSFACKVIQGASSKPESFGWADEIIVFMEKHMEAMQSECSDSKCSSCLSIQSTASSAEACQLCRQPAMVITNQAYCYSSHNPSAVL